MLVIATQKDAQALVDMEKEFFGERAETVECYELLLRVGRTLIEFDNDKPIKGALVTVPVKNIHVNYDRFRALPTESPIRQRFSRGYFDDFIDYDFIAAFMTHGKTPGLVRAFLNLDKAVGFCYGNETDVLENYRRFGCRETGRVPNIHGCGDDIVLTYEKRT